MLYISGMGPSIKGEQDMRGRVPKEVSLENAVLAAKNCALNILAAIEKETGDLNKVKNIIKLLVFVSSEPGFNQQHIVANGASEVFIAVFGDKAGKSARSAVGMAELPLDFPVEIEAMVELA